MEIIRVHLYIYCTYKVCSLQSVFHLLFATLHFTTGLKSAVHILHWLLLRLCYDCSEGFVVNIGFYFTYSRGAGGRQSVFLYIWMYKNLSFLILPFVLQESALFIVSNLLLYNFGTFEPFKVSYFLTLFILVESFESFYLHHFVQSLFFL